MTGEELLRGYRPAGPPPELRARVRSAKAVAERASAERSAFRDWLPALAAAAVIVLFGTLSYRLQSEIEAKLTVPEDRQVVEQWVSPDMEGLR